MERLVQARDGVLANPHTKVLADVERTKVVKHADRLPRKAAIVPYVPVPNRHRWMRRES